MSKNSSLPKALRLLAALALGACCLGQPAFARYWHPSPEAAALEYTQIVDTKDKEVVFVWWIAAPSFHDPVLDPILDKYFILAVVHGTFDAAVDINFVDVAPPTVTDSNGKTLKLLRDDDQPPAVVGMMAGVKSVLVKMIGPMGKGMRLFVYEPGAVKACKPGKVSVPFNGEVYTFDTPLPGCPQP